MHGTNPQYLVEKIIRTRIYESRYWKEDCFALSGLFISIFANHLSIPIISFLYQPTWWSTRALICATSAASTAATSSRRPSSV